MSSKIQRRNKPSKYPFRTMSAGQSVEVAVVLADDGLEALNYHAVRRAMAHASRGGKVFEWSRQGAVFTIERVE